MIWNVAIPFYLLICIAGAVLTALIKARVKKLHPEIHEMLFGTSFIDNNMKRSLKFQKFSLLSSQ